MKQIANGLKQLNKLRIVHRDLKLSNFLLTEDSDDPTIKIWDFGLARQKGSKETSLLLDTIWGTPIYMAPEVLKGNQYDERADLWSMGTILYELLVGHPPFQGKSLTELVEKVNSGRYIIPTSVDISEGCINLISGLLISDPSKRFIWDDFFNHPFITESDEGEEAKEESETSEIDSQKISIVKQASWEKAAKAIKDTQCVITENGDESEFQSDRISDLLKEEKQKRKHEKYLEDEEEKDSNSDENSEKLVLKSSSTEYNFYNSDESRGQSMLSSNSSNIQPFKRALKEPKILNNSLGIVKEVSNNAIEEDPEEDACTFKDLSSSNHTKPTDLDIKEETKQDVNNQSDLSQKSDIDKVIEFMKDLLNRWEMVISFYNERKNLVIIPQEKELAYILNKICYDLKVFITTFSSVLEIKEETNLQIISENNEKVEVTEDLIKRLKGNQEFKNMKEEIVKNFMALSEEVTKTHDLLMNKNIELHQISK